MAADVEAGNVYLSLPYLLSQLSALQRDHLKAYYKRHALR